MDYALLITASFFGVCAYSAAYQQSDPKDPKRTDNAIKAGAICFLVVAALIGIFGP